jgi:hypothetical protein
MRPTLAAPHGQRIASRARHSPEARRFVARASEGDELRAAQPKIGPFVDNDAAPDPPLHARRTQVTIDGAQANAANCRS